MTPSQLQLHQYFVPEFSMKARMDYDPAEPTEAKWEEFSVDSDIDPVSNDDDRGIWQVTIEIQQQSAPETNFPYEFKLEICGFVECLNPDLDDEQKDRLVRINGVSMLYSIAREIIRENTGRGPWEEILIPTVSFFDSLSGEDDAVADTDPEHLGRN